MRLSTRQYSRITIVALLIVSFLLQSCIHTDVVRPDFLLENVTGDITVITKTGEHIFYEEGDYSLLRSEAADSLRGKGRKYNKRTGKFNTPFDSTIAFANIENIRAHEKTVVGYGADILFIVVVSATIFVILLLAFFFEKT